MLFVDKVYSNLIRLISFKSGDVNANANPTYDDGQYVANNDGQYTNTPEPNVQDDYQYQPNAEPIENNGDIAYDDDNNHLNLQASHQNGNHYTEFASENYYDDTGSNHYQTFGHHHHHGGSGGGGNSGPANSGSSSSSGSESSSQYTEENSQTSSSSHSSSESNQGGNNGQQGSGSGPSSFLGSHHRPGRPGGIFSHHRNFHSCFSFIIHFTHTNNTKTIDAGYGNVIDECRMFQISHPVVNRVEDRMSMEIINKVGLVVASIASRIDRNRLVMAVGMSMGIQRHTFIRRRLGQQHSHIPIHILMKVIEFVGSICTYQILLHEIILFSLSSL